MQVVYFQWHLHGSKPLIKTATDYDWIIKKQGLGQLLLVSAWDKCTFWSNLMWHGFGDSSFFEQVLWGNFRPEIDASLRNGPGAKQCFVAPDSVLS